MSNPKTLLELSGADLEPARLENSTLVLIDMQNEYLQGPLALPDAGQAVNAAIKLISRARDAGSQIVHVFHKGREGGMFDRSAERGQAIDGLNPADGESVVEKPLPNAFTGTELKARLDEAGNNDLIIIGFMTHMCVSSTARAALDHGYRVTIDAESCATRDLPDGSGGVVEAATLNQVALAELSDRFAIIARQHY
ncbi:MAG: cysteine hydrolase [Gammaproteobacteria bacterium]|nr:cysteine hydrolase [Gammaproteobacteria bacterium]